MKRTITSVLALVLTTGCWLPAAAATATGTTAPRRPPRPRRRRHHGSGGDDGSGSDGGPGRDDDGGTTAPTTTAAAPEVLTIKVVDEKPVDGVAKLKVKKGDQIHFIVESDSKQEVHLHGYDIAKDAAPGAPAEFELKATIEGVFEAELEDPGVQILKLTVEP